MNYKVRNNGETISLDFRTTVSKRYKVITQIINRAFWNSFSDTSHSFYVGSYGRNTAISTGDIDILVEIPESIFDSLKYNSGNIPSRFLQKVKDPIIKHYPKSDIRADGQIIKINFNDGINFEVLPAFLMEFSFIDNYYRFADSNNGGSWFPTYPKKEQDAMFSKNKDSNGLLFNTCRHIRFIRHDHYSSYKLPGIFIDSFVYRFLDRHLWFFSSNVSSVNPETFEESLLSYFQNTIFYDDTIKAPGSNQIFRISDQSKDILEKILKLMAYGS